MQRTLQCNGLFQTPRLSWGASDQTICGLRTVRPRVHSAATISQNDQLHWNVPDPCEGLVRSARLVVAMHPFAMETAPILVHGLNSIFIVAVAML